MHDDVYNESFVWKLIEISLHVTCLMIIIQYKVQRQKKDEGNLINNGFVETILNRQGYA